MEAFLSFVASAVLTGIVFAKISRPTKLSRQIMFSNIATVNKYIKEIIYFFEILKLFAELLEVMFMMQFRGRPDMRKTCILNTKKK